MRQIVASGEIGEVLLWRGSWLSDEFLDPAIAFDWRFDREMGGSTIADLGSHSIDLAEWMVGPVETVCAQSSTFTSARGPTPKAAGAPSRSTKPRAPCCASPAVLAGVFEVARTCARRPCDFTVEVNGTEGHPRVRLLPA